MGDAGLLCHSHPLCSHSDHIKKTKSKTSWIGKRSMYCHLALALHFLIATKACDAIGILVYHNNGSICMQLLSIDQNVPSITGFPFLYSHRDDVRCNGYREL